MNEQLSVPVNLTADAFLTMDQRQFGDAWRYEMVDGRIVAQAAPNPDHGAILAGLSVALGNRLRGHREFRPEVGSGAVPKYKPRNTARIADGMIRCRDNPRVLFEVVSPSDLVRPKAWTRRMKDLQAVEGAQEIVLLHLDGTAQLYRRMGEVWTYDAVDGLRESFRLDSVGLELPIAEIYEFVDLPGEPDPVTVAN